MRVDMSAERDDIARVGTPEVLFAFQYHVDEARAGRPYDVSGDGDRFLMIKNPDTGYEYSPQPITIVQNWFEELTRLVPIN